MSMVKDHISLVMRHMRRVARHMYARGLFHDNSKLKNKIERKTFEDHSHKLSDLTYGSEEYQESLAQLGEALHQHYIGNDHHPEHYDGGIQEMSLFTLTEMLCDWMAATEQHDDGDIRRSIELNQERFGYSDELKQILHNTVDEFAIMIARDAEGL